MMTSSIGGSCLCFDLCLPALSEDDTQTEAESSKCLLSSSPGAGGLIMMERGENQTHGGGRVRDGKRINYFWISFTVAGSIVGLL